MNLRKLLWKILELKEKEKEMEVKREELLKIAEKIEKEKDKSTPKSRKKLKSLWGWTSMC